MWLGWQQLPRVAVALSITAELCWGFLRWLCAMLLGWSGVAGASLGNYDFVSHC